MQINFDKTSLDVKFVEKTTKSIRLTRDWSRSKEITVLNHDLKNHEVEELIKVITAKGVINIKTFKITYLNEYVNNKFSKFNDTKPFNKPSNENTFKELLLVVTILFSLIINSEKLILQLKIFSPISRIDKDIRELILTNCSIKKYDELAKTA